METIPPPAPPRPFTRDQAAANRAFLRELRRCGNIRDAARAVAIPYGTIQHRRRRHPAFAQKVDAAIAFAHAALTQRGGERRPVAAGERARDRVPAMRTAGGEPVVVRLKDGRLQMRRAQPGKLTRACEQAFLLALSATCNISLAAAAAGASEAAFHRRRRRNPAFRREVRLALERAYERIEFALMESFDPWSFDDDAWRHNDPPAIPSMTAEQAMQQLNHHMRAARLLEEPGTIRRLRAESDEAYRFRLNHMWWERERLEREERDLRRAADLSRGCSPEPAAERIVLPPWGLLRGA